MSAPSSIRPRPALHSKSDESPKVAEQQNPLKTGEQESPKNRSYRNEELMKDTQKLSPHLRKRNFRTESTDLEYECEEDSDHESEHETPPANSNASKSSKIKTTNSLWKKTLLYIFLTCLLLSSMILLIYFQNTPTQSPKLCPFTVLKAKYTKQDVYLWKNLRSGIEDLLNDKSPKPVVFLLLHNGDVKANNIFKDVVKHTTQCFGSSDTKTIEFNSKKAEEDHGYIIETYKKTITEGNVVLITKLNEISGEAAKALHSICDTHSPIHKKVVIFLSLISKEINKYDKPIEAANKALEDLWKGSMAPNELDPILTRVTDQVLLLKEE